MSDSAYTILIAEDDDSIRHALTDVLTASGYEVLALEEGLAAIRAVRERNFDLALLDVAMPGADGFQVLQVMSAERPGTPVIMLTAKGETIDKLLYNGYSTISLGYAGLYECVKYMTGKSHTDPSATPFALAIMQKMNDKCKEWKTAENIDYSLYGTPLESTTYKFAKCLQKRFGVIKGITDKGYITNSYHVNVTEEIDAFTKLEFEAQFQHLSPGGAISYVEVPDMQNNIPAVLEVMKFIYDHIIYAELNTKSDYCQVCGWDGEIQIVEEDGKLIWKCPRCGNTDQDKMNVARRTCGYIGTQFWNQGRTQEIKDRVLHL